jgi:hypothetical protein
LYLAVLAVGQQFQRQGVGEALLKRVVQHTEVDDLPLYPEATVDSARLYEKMNFREGESFTLLNGAYIVQCIVSRRQWSRCVPTSSPHFPGYMLCLLLIDHFGPTDVLMSRWNALDDPKPPGSPARKG